MYILYIYYVSFCPSFLTSCPSFRFRFDYVISELPLDTFPEHFDQLGKKNLEIKTKKEVTYLGMYLHKQV
jgi:hypothetical protein